MPESRIVIEGYDSITMYERRVSAMAVGVSNYTSMETVRGATADVDLLRTLLVEDEASALLAADQFVELKNATSDMVRQAITKWAYERGAINEIFVFYFSGHALPLGNGDLALCTLDSKVHPLTAMPIPTSLISFRELISTMAYMKADPVIIIDACYSGEAGALMPTVMEEMNRTIQADAGSSYALMTSSTSWEISYDTGHHGVFSQALFEVCTQGIEEVDNPYLTLQDLHPPIRSEIEESDYDMTPQLFVGATLPRFAFVKNARYVPRREIFAPYMVDYLRALWNSGNPKPLQTSEIRELGAGIYGNHNKLKLEPWSLVEDGDSLRTRKLTGRGAKFMNGKLALPRQIQRDASGGWEPVDGSDQVRIDQFPYQPRLPDS